MIKKDIYRFIAIIVSIMTIIFINLNNNGQVLNGQSFLWVICAFFLYQVIKENLKIKDKRLIICSTILGMLLSGFYIIGNNINNYMGLGEIISSGTVFFRSMIKWAGYVIIISNAIMLLYTKLNNITCKQTNTKNEESRTSRFFKANKTSFFISWSLIFVSWIPYLLCYYPGIVTPDSVDQIKQALGISILNSHHPILHTMIIKFAMVIGELFYNQNTGIMIYSLLQMLIMSAIFAFTIYYMAKKNMPVWTRVLAILFFAFYPVNSMYSITMWKNILSGGAILLFVICMIEISTNQVEFFKSKMKFILLIIISLFVIYLLNNGIYIIILTIPFLLIACKKNYKKIILFFITILLLNSAINTCLYSGLGIKKGSIREALSIPLQQFARVVTYKESELTIEEKEKIHNFLPVNNLGELYNPTLSDPVKANFNDNYFANNKLEFLTTWIKLFFKFPIEYVESFLCNCYGYWYPEANNWVVARTIIEDEKLQVFQEPIIEGEIIKKVDSLIDKRNIPVISMFFSLGFMFWMLLVVLTYCIYKKNYNLLLAYVPIFILWLTVLASPVFCEFRYLYGMVTCMPILLSMPTLIKEKNEE